MTHAVNARLPGTMLIWTALALAALALALWVGTPISADFGTSATTHLQVHQTTETADADLLASDQPTGKCERIAPNGACFPYHADRAIWSSGLHPFSKTMH